ncbi:ABC transporter permease [Streptomyces sp. SP18CS02]|uniref:ABC transporter permease n=1 Tax=Streptomyces sp. SP18CS02 TaxID=3002531 RepID=UPI002E77FA83|nr:ABC transporter permease [Streptomyces sp. SP18CS02]MEE1751835.1 ABC transporter permease [Streptomyces sp. SP18CS02]
MLNTYRIELRRSPLLTAFPVMIAVDLAVLFGRSQYWIGVWPEASVAAQIVTLFLGPMLAGVSAWQAGRSSRAGMPDFLLAAARPGWRIEAVRLGATLTLGFLAYGIGCLTAAAVSLGDAGPGFLWPSYLLLGAATLVIFASVGHLAGRWWPSPGFTPVVCALGCFISMLSLPFEFDVLAGPPDTHLRPLPVAVRLLLALALAVLAVTAPPLPQKAGRQMPRRKFPRHTSAVAIVSAVSSFVALAAVPAAGELRGERPASATEPLCDRADEHAPRVCVWPEHRKYLPELTRMAQRLDGPALPRAMGPYEFYEFGLRRTAWGDRGFDITEGHVRTAAIAMADQVFTTAFGRCRPPQDERRAWHAIDNIHLWLEYQAMGQDPAAADKGLHIEGVSAAQREATEAARMTPAEQQKWIAQERGHLLRDPSWCRPDERR